MMESSDFRSVEGLPLILAGPILRRTEAQSVTVWLVLRKACTVTLRILATEDNALGNILWKATASTLQLGKSLHVLTITAKPPIPSEAAHHLRPGCLYAYDCSFQGADGSQVELTEALRSAAWPNVSVSYFPHQCPTFALPPSDVEQLQIFHGSCRKAHDRGHDALPILDLAIQHNAARPNHRPHQLFFTGDQIYGDEIADPLLWAIQRSCDRLFDWTDSLGLGDAIQDEAELAAQLRPGQRTPLAKKAAGLTASLKNTPEKAASHLFRFQEYCLTYLLSWSECCWELAFPSAAEQGLSGSAAQRWDEAVKNLQKLSVSQPYVRRALANVPTYMIFDDHDVSDDWNLNRAWCERVYSKPLGRQIVRNALLAYGLFQGWGNTPAQFEPGEVGAELLDQTARWIQSQGQDQHCSARIYQLLGLPELDDQNRPKFTPDGCHSQRLQSSASPLIWHYRVASACHEVIVLDSRTQRGYPCGEDGKGIPQLLSHFAFEQQLHPLLRPTEPAETVPNGPQRLTFVVAPTNVFSLKLLSQAQRLAQRLERVFDADVGDAWNLEEATRARLLSSLLSNRDRVIVLSGDIHFSGTIQVHYRSESEQRSKTLVQLTASAFCNSDSLTGFLHTKLKSLFPESERYWHQNKAYYRTRWIQRQPAQAPPWSSIAPWLVADSGRAQSHSRTHKGLTWLWYSRWLQEGREVVGFNNIGQVQLSREQGQLSVIHKSHWYAPWKPGEMICSRFWTQLGPEE